MFHSILFKSIRRAAILCKCRTIRLASNVITALPHYRMELRRICQALGSTQCIRSGANAVRARVCISRQRGSNPGGRNGRRKFSVGDASTSFPGLNETQVLRCIPHSHPLGVYGSIACCTAPGRPKCLPQYFGGSVCTLSANNAGCARQVDDTRVCTNCARSKKFGAP